MICRSTDHFCFTDSSQSHPLLRVQLHNAMKRTVTILTTLCLTVAFSLGTAHLSFSQEALKAAEDAEKKVAEMDSVGLGVWQKNITGLLGASQVGFQNWQGGGINSIAASAGLTGAFSRETVKWKQVHETRFGLGAVRQADEDLRKAEDLIWLASALLYNGQNFFETFKPTIAATFRSQFLTGFNYDGDESTRVSAFLAPAFLTQAVGLTYEHEDWFSQRFGFGVKETIVRVEEYREAYGNALDESVRAEAGLESFTAVQRQIAENVTFRSTLGAFAAFNDVGNPDLIWENLVTAKVNDWLNVAFEYVALYDRDITTELQRRQGLTAGAVFLLM